MARSMLVHLCLCGFEDFVGLVNQFVGDEISPFGVLLHDGLKVGDYGEGEFRGQAECLKPDFFGACEGVGSRREVVGEKVVFVIEFGWLRF